MFPSLSLQRGKLGALIGFVSFSVYIIGGEWESIAENLNEVYLYGQHLCIILLLLQLAKDEKLVYSCIALFYIFVTAGYMLNDVLDIFIQNKVFIYPTIIMTALCLLYSLKSR